MKLAVGIIPDIEEKVLKYMLTQGADPTVIYIGKKEMYELIEWSKSLTSPAIKCFKQKRRPKIFNCIVYLVNAESHIGVS